MIEKQFIGQDFSVISKKIFAAVANEFFGTSKQRKNESSNRGFLGDCYAVATQLMTLTINDGGDTLASANPQPMAQLREAYLALLARCEKNDMDLNPFYEDDELFGREEGTDDFRLPTRALAASLNMLCLALRDKITFDTLKFDASVLERTVDMTARILESLMKSVIGEGKDEDKSKPREGDANIVLPKKPMGWTCFVDVTDKKDIRKARLFTFADTYLVVEALSRFSDIYKEEGNKARIREMFVRKNHGKTVEMAMRCMRDVAVNFFETYAKSYGEEFFYLDENGNAKPQNVIASGSPVLFYPLYIALISMNGFADITFAQTDILEDAELMDEFKNLTGKEVDVSKFIDFKTHFDRIKNLPVAESFVSKLGRLQKFLLKSKDAMDMVVKKARDLKDKQVDTELMDFSVAHGDGGAQMFRRINKRRIESAYINPLILSAKSLIIIALTKYPERDMKERYEELMQWRAKSKNISQYIWSDDKTSQFSTERSVSAILYDYSDYYNRYEKVYNEPEMRIREKEVEISKRQTEHESKIKEKEAQIGQLEERIKVLFEDNEKQKTSLSNSATLLVEIEKIINRRFFELLSTVIDVYSLSNILGDKEYCKKTVSEHIDSEDFAEYETLAGSITQKIDRSDDAMLDEVGKNIISLKDKLDEAIVTKLWSILMCDEGAVENRKNIKWQESIRRFPSYLSSFLCSGAVYTIRERLKEKEPDSLSNIFKNGMLKANAIKRDQND